MQSQQLVNLRGIHRFYTATEVHVPLVSPELCMLSYPTLLKQLGH